MSRLPIKQNDVIIYKDKAYKATSIKIKKDTDIFKGCRECDLQLTVACTIMNCKNTHFKKLKGGL
jgi:hypothetical protein